MRYGNVELHNVWDIIEGDGKPGVGVCRLPLGLLQDVNPGARNMARLGSGCEIRGMLAEGGTAKVTVQAMDTNTTPPVVTVYHGCYCGQALALGRDPVEIVIKTPPRLDEMVAIAAATSQPFDPHLVRVRFPPIHSVRILSIEGELTYPTPEATPSRTLLCYGSSITHGACASAPEGTYAAQCARYLGCDLIDLGFGGAAHMDPAIAEHIAARDDWDLATFEMGINVREWPLEKFRAAAEQFVVTVAAAHPEKSLFCIDLFTYFADFERSAVTAVGFRDAVRGIVERLGSRWIVYVDGRDILTDPAGLRTDLVHPSDDGMTEMGLNLSRLIAGMEA